MRSKQPPINIEAITTTLDLANSALQELIDDPSSSVLERLAYAEARSQLSNIYVHLICKGDAS